MLWLFKRSTPSRPYPRNPGRKPAVEELEARTVPSGSNSIANGDFEQGYTGYTTGYVTPPTDTVGGAGQYLLVTNPADHHESAASFKDHTSSDGLMMMVNGAADPTTAVWSETVAVAANTDYDLALWLASWTSNSPATLDIQFNGVSIGTPTAPSDTGVWQQFGAAWNSGSATSLTIKIFDTNTADVGNDFALDDLSLTKPVMFGPGNNGATDHTGDGHTVNMDLSDPMTLGPGTYMAPLFNYRFLSATDVTVSGEVTPLVMIAANSDYSDIRPIAIGQTIQFNGTTPFAAAPFGGTNTFTLTDTTTVYAGFYWDSSDCDGTGGLKNPIPYVHGSRNNVVSYYLGAPLPLLNTPITSPASEITDKLFDFSIDVSRVNTAPVVNAGPDATINEGDTFTGSGSFTDPDTDSWTATVDYGDGSGVQALALNADKTFALSHLYDDNGTYNVTVTVNDGQGGVGSDTLTVTANSVPVRAGLSGPSDGSRNKAVRFTFTATSASSADTSAGFTYLVNWGDGSATETIDATDNNGSGVSENHVYANVGVYTVSLTATNKDGVTSPSVTSKLTIKGAQLITDPTAGKKTALVVGGTSRADTIRLTQVGPKIQVFINGVSQGKFRPTGYVIVYGQDGNDAITVDASVTNRTILYGGAGGDAITGGSGPNILIGGDGNDRLTGRGNRDLLIGGTGADKLNGGADADILIAGTTSYDAATAANQGALNAILREWRRPSISYRARVRHLQNGTGVNGVYVLNSTSVFDDTSKDVLRGGSDQDWFLLNLTGGSVLDSSPDKVKNEIATDI